MPAKRRNTRRRNTRRNRKSRRATNMRRGGYDNMNVNMNMNNNMPPPPPAPPMLMRDLNLGQWREGLEELQQRPNQDSLVFRRNGNWAYEVARANGNQYRCRIYLNNQPVSDVDCTNLLD